ncbi:MAG: L-histidine N(alpha)-methyltransferase [Idiomarina sp.]|nr:L-histidine N(alpha)-methyltransferase [Idiomarina sp.]
MMHLKATNRAPEDSMDDIFDQEFLADAMAGLQAQPKALSPKYFYDARGSHFFDLICKLDEYYPYRTEMTLLPEVAKELAGFLPDKICCVEFGAGSLHKIRPLLQHCDAIHGFIPIDISHDHLKTAGDKLAEAFPHLSVVPKAGDFTQPIALVSDSAELSNSDVLSLPRLGFFPGSTIGNFTPQEAIRFLKNARKTLGSQSYFLLGVDTQQDREALHNAYNDQEGVTADFNKNILLRMNRELKANFDLDTFTHEARFNESESRIEMHLVSRSAQEIRIAGEVIKFSQGESIHTENSYKYTPERIIALVESAGWQVVHRWTPADGSFSEVLLVPATDSGA